MENAMEIFLVLKIVTSNKHTPHSNTHKRRDKQKISTHPSIHSFVHPTIHLDNFWGFSFCHFSPNHLHNVFLKCLFNCMVDL